MSNSSAASLPGTECSIASVETGVMNFECGKGQVAWAIEIEDVNPLSLSGVQIVVAAVQFKESIPFYRDCSHVYLRGHIAPGVYMIDPTGKNSPSSAVPVYCKNGWTTILNRGNSSQGARDVSDPEEAIAFGRYFISRRRCLSFQIDVAAEIMGSGYDTGFGVADGEYWLGSNVLIP